MIKDAFIIARVPKSLKSNLEKKAAKRGLDLSKFVREILEQI